MKKLRRFLLFASTMLSSAVNEWRLTGRLKWRTAPKILAALWPRQEPDRQPGSEWWRRMRGCQRCPIYDKRRRACGRVGETFNGPDGIEPCGCGCYLPTKCGVPEASCWLWERTDGALGVDWQSPVIARQRAYVSVKAPANGP